MCDVCEATLFNKHWACGKCGFVVCIDCYRARVNGQGSQTNLNELESNSAKDKDDYAWLFCNNGKSHQMDTLMLTQIIAGDALDEVNNKLKNLTKLNRNNGELGLTNGWENPDKSSKPASLKDETDVKEEKDDEDDDSSTLRDLLSTEQKEANESFGWGIHETEVKKMSLCETEKKYEAKHQWLCNGIVLKLDDPKSKHNSALFKMVWKRCQPVIVSGIAENLDQKLWHPDVLIDLPDHSYDPLHPDTSAVTHGQPIKKFFDGYDVIAKRPQSESGDPLTLRFRENWPAQEDHFAELLPNHYKDLMNNLPLKEYTVREGILNLASRLPDCFVRLDLGPRLWGGYSKSTYNLQYNVSGMIHVMFHTSQNKDLKGDVVDVLKSTGCDELSLKIAKDNPNKVGAIWHVFHPSDADKIKEFVDKNVKMDPKKKPKDPLWLGTMYLKERLLEKLDSELGIKPWSFVQMLGDGVMIPPGAPYQVKVLNASLFVQNDFVSPEHMVHSMKLSFSDGQQFDDRLQVKNVVFHSCKDALSVLEKPTESLDEK